MRHRPLAVALVAAVACGDLSGSSGSDGPAPADAGTDGAITDAATGTDAASDGGDAGTFLPATVFVGPDDAGPSLATGAVSLATEGTNYLYWAVPGANGGLYRKPFSNLAPAAQYRPMNITGVVHPQNQFVVAAVPDMGGNACEVQTFYSSEIVVNHYSEPCNPGDSMRLATNGDTIFMLGPSATVRSFGINDPLPVTVTNLGTGPATFGEASHVGGSLYYTDSTFGRILAAGGTESGTVLASDYAFVGVAVTETYVYATGNGRGGERVIVRATRNTALPLATDRVWTRPAGVTLGDILALPTGQLYWVEGDSILTATPQ